MIRTAPALCHGSGAIDAHDHFAEPLPAEGGSISPSFSMDQVPPSSPSAFTASVASDGPEHKQRSRVGGSKLHSPSSRGQTPYRRPGALLAGALELRFTEKALRPGGDSGISLNDVEKGQPLLAAGLKRLPDKALDEAVLMKHASRETRRFRALASAWELTEARHYSNYLACIHEVRKHEFSGDVASPILVALMQFRHESYNEELESMAAADAQLDSLEAEVRSRIGSSEHPGSASPSYEESLPGSPSATVKNEDNII